VSDMFGPGLWRFGGLTEPLREMQRLQGEMNRIFSVLDTPLTQEFPPLNAWVGEADVVVTAELPGIDPVKVDISIVGDTLTISGSRDAESLKEKESYHRQERSHGRFTRTLQLPFHVETNKVDAKYDRGILQITLPRAEADKPRKISVRCEQGV
jgi:HSP20 family protein